MNKYCELNCRPRFRSCGTRKLHRVRQVVLGQFLETCHESWIFPAGVSFALKQNMYWDGFCAFLPDISGLWGGGGGRGREKLSLFRVCVDDTFFDYSFGRQSKKAQQCNVLQAKRHSSATCFLPPYANYIRVSDRRMFKQRSLQRVMELASPQNL